MTIQQGSQIVASDFVATSAGAADSGKGVKLDSAGKIDRTLLRSAFGGDGSDGALSISSGTTTIDAANAPVVVKNYTSISITGTAKLTISNPHANGTILILKSQGAVSITSSQPGIDMSGMGASASTKGHSLIYPFNNSGTATAGTDPTTDSPGGVGTYGLFTSNGHRIPVFCGGGGSGASSSSSGTPGTGGRGGGGLIIECNGALNFTGTISVAGAVGGAGTNATRAGGGGGGAGGSLMILYTTLTSSSGTVTISGGTGGVPGTGGTGGAGGNGLTGGTGTGGAGAGGQGTNAGASGGGGGASMQPAADGSIGTKTSNGGGGGGGASGLYLITTNTEIA